MTYYYSRPYNPAATYFSTDAYILPKRSFICEKQSQLHFTILELLVHAFVIILKVATKARQIYYSIKSESCIKSRILNLKDYINKAILLTAKASS